jgi:hypothetical protein
MKITCKIELDVPEDAKAVDVERFVKRVRSDVEWAYPTWQPKVSVLPVVGVESTDAGDTRGRRALHR